MQSPQDISPLINAARQALKGKDWDGVDYYAQEILKVQPFNADGYYLAGVVKRVERKQTEAVECFEKGLELDPKRYDIAVELANMYSVLRRNSDAAQLLERYQDSLSNSPRYLDLAGTIYTEVGLSEKALPLYRRALELQPEADLFRANLATCEVFLGNIEEGRKLYLDLLSKSPEHRKNHYQLARLKKADDFAHVEQMKAILANSTEPEAREIPLYFAIAKELEDLQQWDECFDYYKKACDAVLSVTQYDPTVDLALVDGIIENCNADWLSSSPDQQTNVSSDDKTPIFIVGLPRTGTTLVERIVSSHSGVGSLGETVFLQSAIIAQSENDVINADTLNSLGAKDFAEIAANYIRSVSYRLGDEAMFIEKLPLNFLYVGIIARAWPQARIVHMVRDPLDACFSMYKQVFTWAYKYSYSMDHLGQYYVAYDKLRQHWKSLLGDRFIEVHYEEVVTDQEAQTRRLLDKLGLTFEQGCLDFEKNSAPSSTASSVQVRAKVHTGSVQKWKRFETQLQPLREHLIANGIELG